MKERLYVAAALILAAGLSAGAVLYYEGEDVPDAGSYVVVDGAAYAVPVQTSKTYVRDLQRFGGRASVLFDDFDRWFAGLWQGRALGVTVAALSVLVSAILCLFARYLL